VRRPCLSQRLCADLQVGGQVNRFCGERGRRSAGRNPIAAHAVKAQSTMGSSVDLVLLNGCNLGETAAIPPIGQRVLGRWRLTPMVGQFASWL